MSNTVPEPYDTWGLIARLQGMMVIPQGTVVDNGAGSIIFGSKLFVINGYTGAYIEVAAGTYPLPGQSVLVCDIPPTATPGSTVTPTVVSWTNDNRKWAARDKLVLAIGIANKMYLNFDVRAHAVADLSAADISADSTTLVGTGTNVQAVFEELDNAIVAAEAATAAHLADTVDAHDASAISYAGGTGIAATEVEGAIDELATEKANIVGYSTSFPGSPVDGQEHILVDSTSAPTYIWRFRYNASASSSFKWEFIGRSPLLAEVTTGEVCSSTSYGNLTTVGPSITIPAAGDYIVQWGARMQVGNGGGGNAAVMHYDINGAGSSDALALYWDNSGLSNNFITGGSAGLHKHSGLAAADAIVAKYKKIGGNATFTNRWMTVLPIRVS